MACLAIEAICVLIAIALSHGDKRAAALVAMGLFATGTAACFLFIGAYDQPFIGQFSIRPDPLLQVMPEPRAHLRIETTRLSAVQPDNFVLIAYISGKAPNITTIFVASMQRMTAAVL